MQAWKQVGLTLGAKPQHLYRMEKFMRAGLYQHIMCNNGATFMSAYSLHSRPHIHFCMGTWNEVNMGEERERSNVAWLPIWKSSIFKLLVPWNFISFWGSMILKFFIFHKHEENMIHGHTIPILQKPIF